MVVLQERAAVVAELWRKKFTSIYILHKEDQWQKIITNVASVMSS